MPRATRAVILVIAGFALGITVSGIALRYHILRAGQVELQVRGESEDVDLRIPAILVHAVLPFAPSVSAGCGPHPEALSLLREIARELRHVPDGVLVDVRSSGETILVRKEGARIRLSVDTPEETVHVSVPVGLMSAVLR